MATGWRLVAWTGLGVGVLVAGLLATHGTGAEGLRALLRWTARTSGLLFLAAFAASSLRRLWSTPVSRWMLANRRYLGVSTAVSHTYHLGAVIALFAHPELVPGAPTLVGAGVAFTVLYAMAATSSDRAVAWLGRRRWRRLHRVGGWYLWVIFAFTFAGAAAAHPLSLSLVFALLALAVAGLRAAAWRRRARPAGGASQAA